MRTTTRGTTTITSILGNRPTRTRTRSVTTRCTGRWPTLRRLIDGSALSAAGKARAKELFQRLGAAEAAIHGTSMEQVHLHEVGALDSIIDIVGTVFALESLQADRIVSSPLNVGSGTIRSAHGLYPVPAPATLRLLEGAPIYSGPQMAEMVTPTGALLIQGYAAAFGPMPAMRVGAIGYGAGARDFADTPNVLRVLVGEDDAAAPAQSVVVIEAEIDDMNPQIFGLLMDQLLAQGALDVFYTPIQMKKNRPGTLLTIVAAPDARQRLTATVFRETTTIGVRYREMTRECLDRETVTVETPLGPIRFKVARRDGEVLNAAPEFDDCVRLAQRARQAGEGHAGAGIESVLRTSDVRSRALLSHHRHRLRQQPAASRHRLREDHGRRHRPLQAALRHRDVLHDGQRRALAERLQARPRARAGSAGLLRPDGAGVPRGLEAARLLVRRLHPHDASRATGRRCRSWRRPATTPATSTKASTKAGTASRARRSSRRRTSSTASARSIPTLTPEWIREKNYFFRLSKYRDALLKHFAGAPRVPAARHPPQRDPAAARRRARRHLDEPGRPVVGHSAAVRARERRLRLVRRAHQLRRGGRATATDDAKFAHVVAGRPARHRQGHHALPHRGVAGDADERRPRRCPAGVRPRLGELRRAAHEQVARHERRSGRTSRSASGPIRCGST